jgi:hypothetical protein
MFLGENQQLGRRFRQFLRPHAVAGEKGREIKFPGPI